MEFAHRIRLLLQRTTDSEAFSWIDELARYLRRRAGGWWQTWLMHAWIELARKRTHFARMFLEMARDLQPNDASISYFMAIAASIDEDLVGVETHLSAIFKNERLLESYRRNFPNDLDMVTKDPFFDPIRAISGGPELLCNLAHELQQAAAGPPTRIAKVPPFPRAGPSLPYSLHGFAVESFHSTFALPTPTGKKGSLIANY